MSANSQVVTLHSTTDEDKPAVKKLRLLRTSIEVCGQMLEPGAYVNVPREEWEANKDNYDYLVRMGIITVEE